jgi:hypothetical protein
MQLIIIIKTTTTAITIIITITITKVCLCRYVSEAISCLFDFWSLKCLSFFFCVGTVEDHHGKMGTFGTKEQLTMVQIEERVSGWKVTMNFRRRKKNEKSLFVDSKND